MRLLRLKNVPPLAVVLQLILSTSSSTANTNLAVAVPSNTYIPQNSPGNEQLSIESYPYAPGPPTHWQRIKDVVVNIITSQSPRRSSVPKGQRSPNTRGPTHGEDVIVRFNYTSSEEARSLIDASSRLFLDVWNIANGTFDVRVSQATFHGFLSLLPASLQQSHRPLLQGRVFRDLLTQHLASKRPHAPESFSYTPDSNRHHADDEDVFFHDYRQLSVIGPWFRLLESLFPSHVRVISVGTSFEGRDMIALKVGAKAQANSDKHRKRHKPRKIILVTAGSHAREWISTSTVNYLAFQFATLYGRSRMITKLVDNFDWVFVPTVNPDGYEYTWSVDRLWRKNRQDTTSRFCRGIDLDRSWDFMWSGETSDNYPCSEGYAGERPFHATESQQISEWIRNQTTNDTAEFVGFVDLHSYSQQILYPYAFSCRDRPPTLEDLEELAEGLAKVMRRHGAAYDVLSACKGNIVDTTYDMGGSPLDWFYHEMGVRNSYQIKLPDTGDYGFLLPREYIVPIGWQTFKAIVYLGDVLLDGVPGIAETSANFSEPAWHRNQEEEDQGEEMEAQYEDL